MQKNTRINKQISRQVNKAVREYQLLCEGDRIVVGVSGGKDSLTLLFMLSEKLKSVQYDYTLFPVYIDPGFDGSFGNELEEYCLSNGHRLIWEKSDFGIQAHSAQNRANPCFLCSRLRRKRLFEIADQLGSTKLALGHHKDDIIETLLINMFYSGRIGTMVPSQMLFDNAFQIIRPLAYVEEDDIIKFAKERNFPVFTNACPSAEDSKRKEIKDLLKDIYQLNSNIKGNIFRSMSNVNEEYLLT